MIYSPLTWLVHLASLEATGLDVGQFRLGGDWTIIPEAACDEVARHIEENSDAVAGFLADAFTQPGESHEESFEGFRAVLPAESDAWRRSGGFIYANSQTGVQT